ncbi:Na(+)/H(+)-K(+) antiporter GerN [Streptomyces hundungensis]|uniref:Na(+)/H(+)-K(+) antiporter GerN n=1 Tax=Streptomyces hundungensis TaxID=1077946 RepID=A0A387H3W8_9ACTN|nr:Na(+)/H(+)-K(+) antiporter GerN [Streptomyces hundungensis]
MCCMPHPGVLILIMVVAVLAPLLAYWVGHRLPIPPAVFEITLGIVIGPDVLRWAHGDQLVDALSSLGLSMLIFLAGYEIEFAAIRGDTLRRAVGAWTVTLALSLGIAFALTGAQAGKSFVIGTALTSTALGAVLPILRDAGALGGRFATVVMAFGPVGEFGPIVAMSVRLGGRSPGRATAVLFAFALITVVAVIWALRPPPPWFPRVVTQTLHSSGQFTVLFVMLLLACMLGLSAAFGVDTLLGAFVAGLLTRLVLRRSAPDGGEAVLGKIEAMGFGFLVPIFFVVTGMQFDLDALLHGGRPLLLLPVFLLLFLLVRGGPAYLLAPSDFSRRDRGALALYCSTCLPLVVAVTTIGV